MFTGIQTSRGCQDKCSFCHISQEKEHFILKFFRGAGTQDSGTGQAEVIETSKKFEYLLNAECKHAITYLDKDYFALQKCKY